MEILNNTVIIQAEIDMETMAMTLKIPGKMLFDLYSNGKRCIVRLPFDTDENTQIYEFNIIFASKIYGGKHGDQLIYNFLATFYMDGNTQTLNFESGPENEPVSFS